MSTRSASECRSPARSHGQALPGQPDRLWSAEQNVIQVSSSTHDRDQGPRTLVPRKQDPSRRGLHSERSKLDRCVIASTGSRHVVLPATHGARVLPLGRVDIGLASLHRSLRLQAECSGSKIRHSASLSSQCSLQRLAPRLVTARYTVGKSAMTSTAPSSGKTSSVKGKRYPRLPLLSASVMAHYLLPTGTLVITSLPTDEVGSRYIAAKRSKTFLRRKWSCRRGAEGNCPAHYLLPTGTLGIASLPTDEVGLRQWRSTRHRG